MARGKPKAPTGGARRRKKSAPFQKTVRKAHWGSDGGLGPGPGTRPITSEDVEKLHAIFKAWTGVDVAEAWKLFLETELEFAYEVRNLGMSEGVFRLPDGSFIDRPEVRPKSPATILADVVAACPEGMVPEDLTPKMVEAGLENTTDARGGGRGLRAKMNVRTWVDQAASMLTKSQKKRTGKRR